MPKATEQQQQRAEIEENLAINQAVADTEREVWDEALGSEPLDLDADTSLEDMGEGLEGEQLEAEGEEGEQPGVPPGHTTQPPLEAQAEEGEEAAEEGEEPAAEVEEPPQRDNRGALREERTLRRQAEQRFEELQARIETLTQLIGTQQRQAQPQQPTAKPEPKPMPDQFVDPQGHTNWLLEQAEERINRIVESRMSEFERRQYERSMMGVNEVFAEAATGPRKADFLVAYHQLTNLPRNPQNGQLVTRILNSRDPVKAVFDWWEGEEGEDFRQQEFLRLADHYGIELPDDFVPSGNGQRRAAPRQQPQPRHETRLPQSLNAVPGGRGSLREADARGFDGSDQSIFSYATARDV
jgi:hypothetical protein